MPNAAAAELARRLKAVADPVRLRILSIVLSRADGEACACDVKPELSALTKPPSTSTFRNCGKRVS
ncbi:hypothetical protein [Nonomuraea sp. NPDC003709]|uniref:hypothetical protein n=1 Tax=Nonomuraea sp. NPDC003709 TaxID=3154450 RepID=UPI0033A63F6D